MRARLSGLGRVLIDAGPLIVVGDASCGASGSVTVALVGRLSDLRRVHAAVPGARDDDHPTAIARAYERLGVRVLELLRGEWAAIVWDAAVETVVLARDPLGGRSVHHARHGSAVIFGEDARDVLVLLPATPVAERGAISGWLAYGTMPEHGTLYSGISRLTQGAMLQLDAAGVRGRRIWAPSYRPPEPAAGRPEPLKEAIDAAVGRAAADTERLGVLLSGGLDSAIVAAAARAIRPQASVVACSATFPGDRAADESELIDVVISHLGLPSMRSIVDWGRPLLGGLRYLATWRLPSTTPNTFIWLALLACASEAGVPLMLDGQGGDELFDQRPFYLFADLVAHGRLGEAWRLTLRYPGMHPGAGRRHRARILAHFVRRGLKPLAAHRALGRLAATRTTQGQLLRPADARVALELVDEWSWLEQDGPRWWAHRHNSLIRVPQLLDVAGSLRRRAALASIQARHPLMLDQDLVEYALRVPPESSFDPRFDRPLARASQAGRLPDAVRLRGEKSHFSGVLATSLQRGDRALLAQLLDPGTARVREFVASGPLDALATRARRGGPSLGFSDATTLWRLGALECWLRQLEDAAFAADLAERSATPVLEHRVVRVPRIST
jgi:asparagine synthase (glutamine-hydrolysing)